MKKYIFIKLVIAITVFSSFASAEDNLEDAKNKQLEAINKIEKIKEEAKNNNGENVLANTPKVIKADPPPPPSQNNKVISQEETPDNEEYVTVDIPKLPNSNISTTSAPSAQTQTKTAVQTPVRTTANKDVSLSGIDGDYFSTMTPEEIREYKKEFEKERKARDKPTKTPIPKISSLTVDLSAGSSIPIVRLAGGQTSTITFIDSTGQPFPIAATPIISNNSFFGTWLEETNAIVISSLSANDMANMTVFLKGLKTPIILSLVTNDDSEKETRVVDYRIDIRINKRGPNATAYAPRIDKMGLAYNKIMQQFLDGVPPHSAKRIKTEPSFNELNAWQYDGNLYIRTELDLLSDFENTMSSSDGMKIFKLPFIPLISVAKDGTKYDIDLSD